MGRLVACILGSVYLLGQESLVLGQNVTANREDTPLTSSWTAADEKSFSDMMQDAPLTNSLEALQAMTPAEVLEGIEDSHGSMMYNFNHRDAHTESVHGAVCMWWRGYQSTVENAWWYSKNRDVRAAIVALYACARDEPICSSLDFMEYASRYEPIERKQREEEIQYVLVNRSKFAAEFVRLIPNGRRHKELRESYASMRERYRDVTTCTQFGGVLK